MDELPLQLQQKTRCDQVGEGLTGSPLCSMKTSVWLTEQRVRHKVTVTEKLHLSLLLSSNNYYIWQFCHTSIINY